MKKYQKLDNKTESNRKSIDLSNTLLPKSYNFEEALPELSSIVKKYALPIKNHRQKPRLQ